MNEPNDTAPLQKHSQSQESTGGPLQY